MKKTSIYLDTSVINFLYADDAPEKKDITIEFFEDYVKNNIYDVYISPIVIDEINKTTNVTTRKKLMDVITKYNLKILDVTSYNQDEIENLSDIYIRNNIVPARKIEDSLHIAISTVYDIDILLSWNYKHLANFDKERKIASVNIGQGYLKELRMTTPMEVLYEQE